MTKNFLIGQLACFGDCLFATTIAKQIKQDYPDSHVTWAVAKKYASILQGNPHIDTIWELDLPDGDYYSNGWKIFESEAEKRKANGEFDEIIYSQIPPLNWINYNGTIRGTILSSYKGKYTVTKEPVVQLSDAEVENVKNFAIENKLQTFQQVILFECAPGSGQSSITTDFALSIAQTITATNKEVCFILSTPKKLEGTNTNIIDASTLTFRENAALTHYCSLLIGCSSGITWISTSIAAKKIPFIQLLKRESTIFAGIHYDFAINNLDHTNVVEMLDYDEAKVVKAIELFCNKGIAGVKQVYHQVYEPAYHDLKRIVKTLIVNKKSLKEIKRMIGIYKKANPNFSMNYLDLYYHLYIYRHKDSKNIIIQFIKRIIKKKR